MKRREVNKGTPSADLLVCFPTRSHLTLMPKMICSPSKLSVSSAINHRQSNPHQGKPGGAADSGLWPKMNPVGSDLSEPTSPKVTCVGQIKTRPKSRSCKNWQSVMEEIERIHSNKKLRKKPSWSDSLGFKRESMQFLTSLRSFKFDLGCFGAFPSANVTSDDDDDYDDDNKETNYAKNATKFDGYDHNIQDQEIDQEGSSRSEFTKWVVTLEENQDSLHGNQESENPKDEEQETKDSVNQTVSNVPCVPPSNALLLMRCRSAPITRVTKEEDEEEDDDDDDNDEHVDGDDQDDGVKKGEKLKELMRYEGDFYKLSCDIAKETWVVGGIDKDLFPRTQTPKRCTIECLQEVKACLQ